MPLAEVVQPGTSHTGTQASEQNQAGGLARDGTWIGFWQPRQRTVFTRSD